MKELTSQTRVIDPELFTVPEIEEAINLAEEAAYTPAELDAYEGYWKAVSSEKTIRDGSRREGKMEVALLMKANEISSELISKCTGLSINEIERL